MTDGNIVFISVPESLHEQLIASDTPGNEFKIKAGIPVPVEIQPNGEQSNLNDLSREMIISGMLRVIEKGYRNNDPEWVVKPDWIEYYRGFIPVLRPNIMGELNEAAFIKAHNEDFDSALDIINLLEALFPFSPVIRLNRALILEEKAFLYRKSGRSGEQEAFSAASRAYETLLEKEPDFPQAFYNAGFYFSNIDDFKRSFDCFSRFLEITDDDEKKRKAQRVLNKIRKNSLDDDSFARASTLIRKGKAEEGILLVRDFLELNPAVWNGWFLLGWALRLLNRYEDALSALRKAAELGGANSDTRNELAICLLETGDLAGAGHELETALKEDPENIKIISNLGALAMKTGDNDTARAYFRTVLELDGGDSVAKAFLDS
ncbi:MAG: tetratricopeptide repeat protein [Treponema sp.]|jgi:tetratricopeptide (TPR) repeat protein|nr:tetratricopeptide repeat protein [Treponema sp.]